MATIHYLPSAPSALRRRAAQLRIEQAEHQRQARAHGRLGVEVGAEAEQLERQADALDGGLLPEGDASLTVDSMPVSELLALGVAMEGAVPVLEARPCFWCTGTDGKGCAECFVDGGKVG